MVRNVPQDAVVLRVSDLRTLFPVPRGMIGTLLRKPRRYVHAVDGVSFSMVRGEILGLVGESGSGKTTTALNVLGLVEPTEGEILFNGQSVPDLVHSRERLRLRRQMQIVFQDPYEALNPRQTVFATVAEPLEVHRLVENREDKLELVTAALDAAGLKPPETFFDRYPQGLSGGQRQRVVIAGALVLNPELLVADEPVSMLDVSIRAEILNLLRQLRDERGITILYITHDLATAACFTDRVAVMYLGRIVEIGPTGTVLSDPRHPYTQALLSVIPIPNPRWRRKRIILTGETPNPIDLPSGCRFHPRCPVALDECSQTDQQLQIVAAGHEVACLRVQTNPG
jgi:oligopeptide/dipeptide ABC transporter ATP-binding protein